VGWAWWATLAVGLGEQLQASGREAAYTVLEFSLFPFSFKNSRNLDELLKYVENIIRIKKYKINFYRILESRSW
jgi:hypothetical protein